MIVYCDARLREWGEWSWCRNGGAVPTSGYLDEPRIAPYASLSTPDNLRCLESEAGVGWLLKHSRRLGDAVCICYRDHVDWSTQMQAEFLHVSRMSLWRYIDRAHQVLLEYWVDRACGLVPQTERLRQDRRQRLATTQEA